MGELGTWLKISADPQTYGFLHALAEVIRITPITQASRKVMGLLEELALHCPIDVYPFELTPDLEKRILLKSFQLMEDYRKREEEQAPTA